MEETVAVVAMTALITGFALPVVLVFALGYSAFTGDWGALPGQLGLSLGVLFTGLGLSSVVSARYTVAVPLPGAQIGSLPASASFTQ